MVIYHRPIIFYIIHMVSLEDDFSYQSLLSKERKQIQFNPISYNRKTRHTNITILDNNQQLMSDDFFPMTLSKVTSLDLSIPTQISYACSNDIK